MWRHLLPDDSDKKNSGPVFKYPDTRHINGKFVYSYTESWNEYTIKSFIEDFKRNGGEPIFIRQVHNGQEYYYLCAKSDERNVHRVYNRFQPSKQKGIGIRVGLKKKDTTKILPNNVSVTTTVYEYDKDESTDDVVFAEEGKKNFISLYKGVNHRIPLSFKISDVSELQKKNDAKGRLYSESKADAHVPNNVTIIIINTIEAHAKYAFDTNEKFIFTVRELGKKWKETTEQPCKIEDNNFGKQVFEQLIVISEPFLPNALDNGKIVESGGRFFLAKSDNGKEWQELMTPPKPNVIYKDETGELARKVAQRHIDLEYDAFEQLQPSDIIKAGNRYFQPVVQYGKKFWTAPRDHCLPIQYSQKFAYAEAEKDVEILSIYGKQSTWQPLFCNVIVRRFYGYRITCWMPNASHLIHKFKDCAQLIINRKNETERVYNVMKHLEEHAGVAKRPKVATYVHGKVFLQEQYEDGAILCVDNDELYATSNPIMASQCQPLLDNAIQEGNTGWFWVFGDVFGIKYYFSNTRRDILCIRPMPRDISS